MEKAQIKLLFEHAMGSLPIDITPLAGAGSPRRYYRVADASGATLIATCGDDVAENRAFIYLARHFRDRNLHVPEVLAVNDDSTIYLQTDLGDVQLFDVIKRSHDEASPAVEASMRMLARVQHEGARGLDFSRCYPTAALDRRAVMWDLNYFKYCFLKPLVSDFSEADLEDDFELFVSMLLEGMESCDTLMVRDFQSRNIMLQNGSNPYLIDFQGARRGPACYDVASFLWQAKAEFSDDERRRYVDAYLAEVRRYAPVDDVLFGARLRLFAFFRTLQVLGAYGFRGYLEQKSHFLTSIPSAIANLKGLLGAIPDSLGELKRICCQLCSMTSLYAPETSDGLTVRVVSFSYKKGVPRDPSGNGGGFVFDCRAVHNPGRYDEYKSLTGMDLPVREFLERDGEILTFLNNAYGLVDASVERYLRRGFSNLMVCFGCTGGRHRSVYSAEAMARHISEKFGCNVLLEHREQGVRLKFPPR